MYVFRHASVRANRARSLHIPNPLLVLGRDFHPSSSAAFVRSTEQPYHEVCKPAHSTNSSELTFMNRMLRLMILWPLSPLSVSWRI